MTLEPVRLLDEELGPIAPAFGLMPRFEIRPKSVRHDPRAFHTRPARWTFTSSSRFIAPEQRSAEYPPRAGSASGMPSPMEP